MRSRKAAAKRPMTIAGQAARDLAGRRRRTSSPPTRAPPEEADVSRAGWAASPPGPRCASRLTASSRDSAAGIRGVEPRRLDAVEARGRDLDAGVVGRVGPGVLEDRKARGDDDRHALGLERDVAIVAVALRAGADPAVAETGDPAAVRDDLVVRAC